tara:strand:+ start:721 stop:1143 length:423 start_codon:yes stop_codon:yes gene_type:complete
MKNFLKEYLELKDIVYNIRVITASVIHSKSKAICKNGKGISENRIGDLKNFSYDIMKDKITNREFSIISNVINEHLGVDITRNSVGLDCSNYVNIDNKIESFTIKDIEKAWMKNYNNWFKEGYNIESIFAEFKNELLSKE